MQNQCTEIYLLNWVMFNIFLCFLGIPVNRFLVFAFQNSLSYHTVNLDGSRRKNYEEPCKQVFASGTKQRKRV